MSSLAALHLAFLFAAAAWGEAELKALGGPEPTPLRAPHFPRPLDEYVFRNWGAAPPERIAAAIGASVDDVRGLAEAMGLGRPPSISPESWRRSSITVIRRNWHILPYEQLLKLLDWDEARLAFALREDDFLWVKLGSQKPRCVPIAFQLIPEELRPRYESIRSTVADVLGPEGLAGFRRRFAFLDELGSTAAVDRRSGREAADGEVALDATWSIVLPPRSGEVARAAADRFAAYLGQAMRLPGVAVRTGGAAGKCVELVLDPSAFAEPESHEIRVEPGRVRIAARDEEGLLRGLDRLKDRFEEFGGPSLVPCVEKRPARFSVRFLYSYSALYGDPLLEPDLDPYPDGYLEKLSRLGVNGVWLQAVLRNLAPEGKSASGPFSSFGKDSGRRIESLRALVKRANRFGIGVYLYLNEPRAMPESFFSAWPDLAGVAEAGHRALCTSRPEVRAFINDALAHVFASVPDLAGVFSITMSENFTNCWSHGQGKSCPRCGRRPGHEVIAEVNRTIFEGIRRSSPRASVIAWDWGWPDDWIEPIAAALPPDVALMSVSEWSLPIRRAGVESTVGEYSMSAVGPGPRAKRAWEAARKTGRPAFAKIQANNTWELSAVPYIPVVERVAEHLENLSGSGVEGLLLSWTLGGYPSPNLEAAAEYYFGEPPSDRGAAEIVALRRFGSAGARAAKAWHQFGAAFSQFPFHGGLVYTSPVQFGPANLLYPAETGFRATMIGFPYDDLETWRAIYPAEAMVGALQAVVRDWESGLPDLREGEARTGYERLAIRAEKRVAHAAVLHWKSAAAQARFVLARRAYRAAKEPREARRQLDAMRGILIGEIGNARTLLGIVRSDSRIGFEASNHYYYLPVDLVEKVVNCRYLLETWIPEERRKWEEEAKKESTRGDKAEKTKNGAGDQKR